MPALILMYHDLAESLDHVPPEHQPYVLTPAEFRRQMKLAGKVRLRSSTVAEWCDSPTSERPLVLTFDDGHVSNHDAALPILLEHGLKATFFITAGRIGAGATLNWAQIRELHRAGMEIGSHTLTHRPPSTLSDEELRYELSESRRILEDGLGAPIRSVSSPTGFFNARMRDVARETGYRALCHGRAGFVADGADPFDLNRIAVKRSMVQNRFEALLNFRKSAVMRLRIRQWTLEHARKSLGVESYLRLRRLLIRASGS